MRIFGVDYQFLSCGNVFTRGLERAASVLGIEYTHAGWDAPDLEQQVVAFHPDLLFVVHGRRFCQRFPNFGFAKRSVWQRSAIWLLDEPYEVDDTAGFSNRFDHVFVNDPATLSRHPRSLYLPVCYDPGVHHPGNGHKGHRVGFIGGPNPQRARVLGALARANLLSYVVGGEWDDEAITQRCLAINIAPAMTARLYSETMIVVNVFREQHHFNSQRIAATSMNPRIYEALACGALVVSEYRDEVARYLPYLPTFRTPTECVDVIQGLLMDRIAANMIRIRCAETLSHDTYADRLRTVVETVQAAAVPA
jgi:hypothetical protein